MTERICAYGRDHGYSCCPEHSTHKMRSLGGHTRGCPDRVETDAVPTKEQIEAGARAIPVDYYDHDSFRIVRAPEWDVSEAVLKAVLPDIEAKIKAAQAEVEWPETMYGDGILTGLRHALDIVRGKQP